MGASDSPLCSSRWSPARLAGAIAVLMLMGGCADREGVETEPETTDIAAEGSLEEMDAAAEAGGRLPIAPAVEEYMSTCVDRSELPIDGELAAQCAGYLVDAVGAVVAAGVGESSELASATTEATEAAARLDSDAGTEMSVGRLREVFESALAILERIDATEYPALEVGTIQRSVANLGADQPLADAEGEIDTILNQFGEALSTISGGSAAAGI